MPQSDDNTSKGKENCGAKSVVSRRQLLKLSSTATLAGAASYNGPALEALASPRGTSQEGAPDTYTNPIIDTNTADVTVIRALDGYYYLVSSSLPWPGGGRYHRFPIFRSRDLVNWTFVVDAFTSPPEWKGPGILAAPYLTYFNTQYYLYYCVFAPRAGSSIGVATADTITGPWEDLGRPLILPRKCGSDQYCFIIGPSFFVGEDGQKYLYYGSYQGGIWVQKLTADGLATKEPVYQIGHAHRYEATYAIRRPVDGEFHTYLLNSTGRAVRDPTPVTR